MRHRSYPNLLPSAWKQAKQTWDLFCKSSQLSWEFLAILQIPISTRDCTLAVKKQICCCTADQAVNSAEQTSKCQTPRSQVNMPSVSNTNDKVAMKGIMWILQTGCLLCSHILQAAGRCHSSCWSFQFTTYGNLEYEWTNLTFSSSSPRLSEEAAGKKSIHFATRHPVGVCSSSWDGHGN